MFLVNQPVPEMVMPGRHVLTVCKQAECLQLLMPHLRCFCTKVSESKDPVFTKRGMSEKYAVACYGFAAGKVPRAHVGTDII